MITRPFPPEAERIRQAIRREVKRPEKLPITTEEGFLRWEYDADHWADPMVLLGEARGHTMDDLRITLLAINAFASWWDSQTDAEAAVKEVWG